MPHPGEGQRVAPAGLPPGCCPHLHEAVELVGRRWTGAILEVLRQSPRPLRFSEVAQSIPELSDRLCSERMKELERRGLVRREVHPGPPVRVTYELTEMGHALEPALTELKSWAQAWLARRPVEPDRTVGPPTID
jgi:DNA-binding HxlR family transcriptional regulator